MRPKRWRMVWIGLLGLFLAGIGACSTPRPYLPIRYAPPSPGAGGVADVAVRFLDQRAEKTFLTPAAAAEMKDFTGHYALVLTPSDGEEVHLGSQGLADLFHNALERRLSAAGLRVVPEAEAARALLEFRLEAFRLDLSRSRWRMRIAYTAEMRGGKDARRSASQTVEAEGERRKLIGSGQAEQLVGEVFTDAVNRIDPISLLRRQ